MLDYGDMKYKESLKEIDNALFELCSADTDGDLEYGMELEFMNLINCVNNLKYHLGISRHFEYKDYFDKEFAETYQKDKFV